jgi:hypothetical protein
MSLQGEFNPSVRYTVGKSFKAQSTDMEFADFICGDLIRQYTT